MESGGFEPKDDEAKYEAFDAIFKEELKKADDFDHLEELLKEAKEPEILSAELSEPMAEKEACGGCDVTKVIPDEHSAQMMAGVFETKPEGGSLKARSSVEDEKSRKRKERENKRQKNVSEEFWHKSVGKQIEALETGDSLRILFGDLPEIRLSMPIAYNCEEKDSLQKSMESKLTGLKKTEEIEMNKAPEDDKEPVIVMKKKRPWDV